MPEEPEPAVSLAFLRAGPAETYREGPYVVIVRTREEFAQWLAFPRPGVECLQVEGLLDDPEVWALAAQGPAATPLDVVLDDPGRQFSALYRLADARIVRQVRVTMPAKPGFLKALRLAASLQLPVLLLPGQPDAEALAGLEEAARFYLHDPMVEAPVEFFHSVLAVFRGVGEGVLWTFLEQDPGEFVRRDDERQAVPPARFVETHVANPRAAGAECVHCQWRDVCAGYFKWPDPSYPCAGVKQLFALLKSAADEITGDLASHDHLASLATTASTR